jgi:predicted RNA-binding protein YlqC (UPF0109 family)
MTAAAQVEDLLRDLCSAFVERPELLKVASQESLTGECFFALQGAPEDEPILVGKHGSHVDALTWLVAQFGEAEERAFTFRLVTPGERGEWEPMRRNDATEHDPRPARDLLCRILEAIGATQFSVEVGPGTGARSSLLFIFTIRPRDSDDHARLITPRRVVVRPALPECGKYPARPERAIESTFLAAVGTLFRAISRKTGARYSVAVVPPNT